jgi:hypothetical protein
MPNIKPDGDSCVGACLSCVQNVCFRMPFVATSRDNSFASSLHNRSSWVISASPMVVPLLANAIFTGSLVDFCRELFMTLHSNIRCPGVGFVLRSAVVVWQVCVELMFCDPFRAASCVTTLMRETFGASNAGAYFDNSQRTLLQALKRTSKHFIFKMFLILYPAYIGKVGAG